MGRIDGLLLDVRSMLQESESIKQRIKNLDQTASQYHLEKLTIPELLEFERLLQRVVIS